MKKLQIKIPVLLPNVPDEKDHCIDKLISKLQVEKGIEKIHISYKNDEGIPLLCFHYHPTIISISHIESLAKQAGANLTDTVGHKLFEVSGIRHTRHAKQIEKALLNYNGILEASVSNTGFIRIEYEIKTIDETTIVNLIKNQKLSITTSIKHDQNNINKSKKKEVFGAKTELIFAVACGVFLGLGFGLSFFHNIPSFAIISLYSISYFFGAFYTTRVAIQSILKGRFEIDFLMLVAAIGAAVLGNWAEGALLLFLFSIGHSLEHYAMGKAQKSIAALAGLASKTALVKKNNITEEVRIEDLKIADIIVVRPNTKIPADGVIIKGQGSVNQASITGESMPVDKLPYKLDINNKTQIKEENRVYAGTINGNSLIEISVLKLANDSTLARLVKLVNEAQTQKSPTQLFADKFEKYFVPVVLVLVLTLNFAFLILDEPYSASFYRSMAVLVAASPCALAISTPSAVLSAIARAARGGVLIKGGRPLEDLGEITAIAFDKTGTLTEGKPKLINVIALNEFSEEKLLNYLITVESLSNHPLAKAIVLGASERVKNKLLLLNTTNTKSLVGRGIIAMVEEDEVSIGNLNLFLELDKNKPSQEIIEKVNTLEMEGKTTMLIRENLKYIGIIALMDTPRKEAHTTLEKLKKIGIKRMIMLTGDNQKVADAVAKEIGIKEAWGSLLPEAKVKAIKDLMTKENKVAMVGDGVNDAPAMANSSVGIAMGAAGSDVALETADIALMADNLENLPFAIGLSRKSKRIIKQNIWISLGVVALLIPMTMFGIANLGIAVLIHEGSTLVVVLNALRLLAYKQN